MSPLWEEKILNKKVLFIFSKYIFFIEIHDGENLFVYFKLILFPVKGNYSKKSKCFIIMHQ